MGDRANLIIKQSEGLPPVVVYSHWGGHRLTGGATEKALMVARGRTGDANYFTAILIEQLFKEDLVSGIGTTLDDNEHPIVVVNTMTGEREEDMTEQAAREYLKQFRLVSA